MSDSDKGPVTGGEILEGMLAELRSGKEWTPEELADFMQSAGGALMAIFREETSFSRGVSEIGRILATGSADTLKPPMLAALVENAASIIEQASDQKKFLDDNETTHLPAV